MNKYLRPLSALGSALALAAGLPQVAHAQTIPGFVNFNLGSIIVSSGFLVIQFLSWAVTYFIAILFSFTIAIQTFVLGIILQMNFDIVNGSLVQVGFSIVLAFANILFVAAMIVMAVATILRANSYGVKQLLFKIVIAAIGVNFSLVLAGTVLTFSDQLSTFFITRSLPGNPASTGGESLPLGNMHLLADRVAGAFQPQKAFEFKQDGNFAGSTGGVVGVLSDAGATVTTTIAALLGVGLSLLMLLQVSLFVGVMEIAFLLRYLWLSMLLVTMPAVWVAWIFPFTNSYVKKWSSKFISWTFFGPVAFFFLYLSMSFADVLRDSQYLSVKYQSSSTSKGVLDALQKILSDSATPLVELAVKAAFLGGSMWMGLFLAHRMGISVAGTGVKIMENAGASIKNNISRRAKSAGLRQLDRVRTGGKDADGNSRLQRIGSRLSVLGSKTKIPGLDAAGKAIAKAGVADADAVKKRVAETKKDLSGLTKEALVERLHRLSTGSLKNPDEEAAILETLKDKKGLGEIKKASEKRVNDAAAKRDDNGKVIKDADGNVVEDPAARKKAEEVEDKRLKDLFKRQSEAGNLKDVLKADPRLAEYAPLPLKKSGDKAERLAREAAGSTTERITVAEAIGQNIKTVGKDDVANIANDGKLFGTDNPDEALDLDNASDTHKEHRTQVEASLALKPETLKAIGGQNLETIDRIDATMAKLTKIMEKDAEAAQADPTRANENWKKFFAYKFDADATDADVEKHRREAEMVIQTLQKTLTKSINFNSRSREEDKAAGASNETPRVQESIKQEPEPEPNLVQPSSDFERKTPKYSRKF